MAADRSSETPGGAERSADDFAEPEFVREALAEEPGESSPLSRLPELLTPVAVTSAARERLLSAVAEPPLRYAPFYDRLSALWRLPERRVVEVLERSKDPKAWRKPPLPGLELMNVEHGAGAGGEAYLARFGAGMTFPTHRHVGHEEVLLLEGSYTDRSGTLYRSGDLHRMEPGSEHEFHVDPSEPCIAAALHHAIEFSSVWLRLLAKFFG